MYCEPSWMYTTTTTYSKSVEVFYSGTTVEVMAATNKDVVLIVSLVLSLVSLVLLFGVTVILGLLQQQIEYDKELLRSYKRTSQCEEMCIHTSTYCRSVNKMQLAFCMK